MTNNKTGHYFKILPIAVVLFVGNAAWAELLPQHQIMIAKQQSLKASCFFQLSKYGSGPLGSIPETIGYVALKDVTANCTLTEPHDYTSGFSQCVHILDGVLDQNLEKVRVEISTQLRLGMDDEKMGIPPSISIKAKFFELNSKQSWTTIPEVRHNMKKLVRIELSQLEQRTAGKGLRFDCYISE